MGEELLKAVKEFSEDGSRENEILFIKELLETRFHIPTNAVGQLIVITNEKKEDFIPAFTNIEKSEALVKVQEKSVTSTYESLKKLVLEEKKNIHGIIINPTEEDLLIQKEQIIRIDSLVRGMSLNEAEGFSTGIQLLVPNKVSDGLISDVNTYANNERKILQINVYQAKRKAEEGLHWLFLVQIKGKKKDVFPVLASIIEKHMQKEEVFELMQATDELELLHSKEDTIIYKK